MRKFVITFMVFIFAAFQLLEGDRVAASSIPAPTPSPESIPQEVFSEPAPTEEIALDAVNEPGVNFAADAFLAPLLPSSGDAFGYLVSTQPLASIPNDLTPFWIDEFWPGTRWVNFTLPVLDNAISERVTIGPDQDTPGLVGQDPDTRHPFYYYDNGYNYVYISMNGVVRFADTTDSDFRNYPMPTGDLTPAAPLSFLASFWADLDANYPENATYYNSTLPETQVYVTYLDRLNPYEGSFSAFAITWLNACRRKSDEQPFTVDDQLSFQVVFKDNGDIFVNLKDLPTQTIPATIGIQDREGSDGVMYYFNGYGSNTISENFSIKFTRPSPDYRMRVYPTLLGGLAFAGSAGFTFNIKNITEITGTIEPVDIYDLSVTDLGGWTVTFYDQNMAFLKDTNLNGKPDTGPVGLNEVFTVIAQVGAPSGAAPGEQKTLKVDVKSFKAGYERSTNLQVAVPAAFSKTFSGGTGTYLDQIWKINQSVTRVAGFSGDMLTVENTLYGFTYAWSEYNPLKFKNYLNFSFIDRLGFQQYKSMFDHGGTANDTFPSLAVNDSNGDAALVWLRESGSQILVMFALLNQNAPGGLVLGPLQIDSVSSSDHELASPVVAFQLDGSQDYTVAWVERDTNANLSQIKGAVVTSAGSVSGVANLLPAAVGGELYGLTFDGLDGSLAGQAILFYVDTSGSAAELRYIRLNDTVRQGSPVTISNSVSLEQRVTSSDRIDGNILVAWLDPSVNVGAYDLQGVSFVILDGSTLTSSEIVSMANPNLTNADYISVTADHEGQPVLVWTDADAYRYVFYAYINPTGYPSWFITNPLLIQTLPAGSTINLSGNGQGLAAYDGRYTVGLPLIRK